jgi:flagellar basal-body rod protein FlgB
VTLVGVAQRLHGHNEGWDCACGLRRFTPGDATTMINALFNSTSIPVLEQVVGFTEARHNVLAGDIANLDTPGYHLRDLDPDAFRARLKEAIDIRDGRRAAVFHGPHSKSLYSNGFVDDGTTASSPRSADVAFDAAEDRSAAIHEVNDSQKSILYHDDSDFGLEQLVTEVAKNQTEHSLAIAILRSQFALLQAAISERA